MAVFVLSGVMDLLESHQNERLRSATLVFISLCSSVMLLALGIACMAWKAGHQ